MPRTTALPAHLLAHTPRLTRLVLNLPRTTALPAHLLAHTPRLTRLVLNVGLEALPPELLAHTPHLADLVLNVGLEALPAGLLVHTPHLTRLGLGTHQLEALPPGLLAHTPRLADLTLNARQLEALPESLLSQTSNLVTLHLQVPQVILLPGDLLAHTPRLTDFHLQVNHLPEWPADLLEHVPHLKALSLVLGNADAWPQNLLDPPPPQIEAVDLAGPCPALIARRPVQRAPFPYPVGLGPAPTVRLARGFRVSAPFLTDLSLPLPQLPALPPDFLAHTPYLSTSGPGGAIWKTDSMGHSRPFTSRRPGCRRVAPCVAPESAGTPALLDETHVVQQRNADVAGEHTGLCAPLGVIGGTGVLGRQSARRLPGPRAPSAISDNVEPLCRGPEGPAAPTGWGATPGPVLANTGARKSHGFHVQFPLNQA